jgi:hypothetical protein
MSIRVSDFSALCDDLQEVFQEASADAIAEMVGPKLFKVSDTDRRTFDYQVIHGISGIQKVAEGADLPRLSSVQGDSITWTQGRYGALVPVSKDMRLFDLYSDIERMVRSVVDDCWQKLDSAMAEVLLNGFSASNYTDVYGESVSAACPDAVALFSASHSNNLNSNVFRNLIRNSAGSASPGISRDAIIQARIDAANHKDANGVNRPINLDLLLVAPAKYDEALRIINSDGLSGEFTRDNNPLKGSVKVVQWSRLSSLPDGTDTSAYFFMADSKKVGESLRLLFAERPSLDAPEQVYANKDWEWSLDEYHALGRAFPAYIWGSAGTA